jgi:hypothetical protein
MSEHAPISLVARANPVAVGRGREGVTVVAEGLQVAYVNGTRRVTEHALHLRLNADQAAALWAALGGAMRGLEAARAAQLRLGLHAPGRPAGEERGDGDAA